MSSSTRVIGCNQPVQPQSSAERSKLTTREAMDLIGAPSMTATYSWLHRHGILRDGYGRIDRFDIERARKRRSRRGRHPNSLANLNSAQRIA